jgi:magnesium-transporting ATPase (P-type)
VFRIGIFSNYTIILGIGAILILQTLLIYTPFMQSVFGTTSLDFRDILISVASGFVIFPLIVIEKYFISLHARRKLIYSKCT